MQLFNNKSPQPFSQVAVLRLFVVITVLLAFATGYFQALYKQEQKKYVRLEDMYVRVRGQLGREETQRLIDLSREFEK